ncbi:metallophosphoesterase [Cohnella nanjingensis]|uniref:Metallophosphoesterase n=1 Tax=Cohnella nanjingensis TaxID=1387779 RepID=A0A7X0RZH9_9BACL|nr:metallophosphoesterase [Cohnella nanjingensis]MBB6674944.1 metallophosphoesterase [Cohnella nanjingensis]
MKIGILSDLHVDKNNAPGQMSVQEALARSAREREAELLIVAGDVSDDHRVTLRVLEEIERKAGVPCLFVPGNHDLWNVARPDEDAWTAYEALLQFRHNLASAPYLLGDRWVVIGDAGWFDFSFGNADRYAEADFLQMELGGRMWKDKRYVRWDRSPADMARYFRDKLETQLAAYEDRHIIFVTHVVPDASLTIPESRKDWDYFNAFLGSRLYGDLIREYGHSIPCAISGHVHYRKQVSLNGTELISSCLGYRREWRHSQDTYREVSRALGVIDIDVAI